MLFNDPRYNMCMLPSISLIMVHVNVKMISVHFKFGPHECVCSGAYGGTGRPVTISMGE